MTDKPRSILVTFAGRRDRMEILARYVDAAIARGLIDEWHVWDFTRNAEDARWLRAQFPVAQATSNHSLEYFRSPQPLELRGEPVKLSLEVHAANDVHLGLRRVSEAGPSYEIVLGGWNNMASAIRTFEDAGALGEVAARDPAQRPVVVSATPCLLPEFGFLPIEVKIGARGLAVRAGDKVLLRHAGPIAPGAFDVLYRTGFGANGDWRFPAFAEHRKRLFVAGPEPYYPPDAMFYNRAYQYYVRNRGEFQDDVILKCDDDIVFFDLDQLAEFVAFRRGRDDCFLVSANVVNNGVCAHFQQLAGAIPSTLGTFESPPGGLCGSLWSEGKKAEALHAHFLEDPSKFTRAGNAQIVWNERISINFIAMLGCDLAFVPDVMADDEHDFCYGVRKRAQKNNVIFPGFVASHLSFWRQDAAMDVDGLIGRYAALAEARLGKPALAPPARKMRGPRVAKRERARRTA